MTTTPFLKWAGGKRQILPEIIKHVPSKFNSYFEPFLGGGAVFFALSHKITTAILSDTNPELINAYIVVRDRLADLIYELETHLRSYIKKSPEERERYYYKVRDEEASPIDHPIKRAARMIFLNKTCFNGLYRTNKKGGFNVPHGDNANPNICDGLSLFACSEALKKAEICCSDFRIAMCLVEKGDFVYLDPPYIPLKMTSFTKYTKEGFGLDEHKELATFAAYCQDLGATVLASGSGSPETRKLYRKSFALTPIKAKRSINRDSESRGEVKEFLIHSKENPL